MSIKQKDDLLKIYKKKDKYEYFSKGILSSSLLAIGMDMNTSHEIASKIEQKVSSIVEKINKKQLIKFITSEIEKRDKQFVERYIAKEGEEKYKPIVILLAGVPGIGKSTLASLLSQRLEISNIIWTDMIREILRQTISPKLVPELHCSSYEAYKHLKSQLNPVLHQSIIGYEEQSRLVVVGIEAAIQSALFSRENTIIEGVHLSPNILKPSILQNPHVVLILLYLKDEKEHLLRFQSRETKEVFRKAKKYIDEFKEIRSIQDYLYEVSIKAKVPVIDTYNNDDALNYLTDTIWERIISLERTRIRKKIIKK